MTGLPQLDYQSWGRVGGRQFPEVTRPELTYEKGQPSVAPMSNGRASACWQPLRVPIRASCPRVATEPGVLRAAHLAFARAVGGDRVGDLGRISHRRYRLLSGRVVTCCDRHIRLTLRFRSIAGIRNRPGPSGSSPAGRCPMTTAVPATALAAIQPAFTDAERLALAGFLVGYRGLTREAYALDLRQFTTWYRARSLALFAVRGAASNPSPGSWRLEAGPGRPSHSGCAPSPGSAVRGRRRAPRAFPCSSRPPSAGGPAAARTPRQTVC